MSPPPSEWPGAAWVLPPASLLALLASLALCATCRKLFPKTYTTFQPQRDGLQGRIANSQRNNSHEAADEHPVSSLHLPRPHVVPQEPPVSATARGAHSNNNEDKGGRDSEAVMMENPVYRSADEFPAPAVSSTSNTLYATVLTRQRTGSAAGSVTVNPVRGGAAGKTSVRQGDPAVVYATVDKLRLTAPDRGARPQDVAPAARPAYPGDAIYDTILEFVVPEV